MRRVVVPTAVFAVLVFVGYALLGDSSLAASLVKALVVGAVFGVLRWWMVRRQVDRRDDT
jgi:hypothetical protein